jgi:hypothetical protein
MLVYCSEVKKPKQNTGRNNCVRNQHGAVADEQDEILVQSRLRQQFGPNLGRPRVDTLKASRHANMKELRFDAADGAWRVAFAFDPKRRAILLVAAISPVGVRNGSIKNLFERLMIALMAIWSG